MPNTYTQLYIQTVFAVKYRFAMINKDWKDELYKYITAIFQNRNHKLLQINGMPDHIHIFCGWNPSFSISDMMKIVKRDSSIWINENKFTRSKFSWQDGFGAFSYARSQVPAVVQYIINQEKHHQKKTFLQEYKEMLDAFDISYDQRYLFCEPI